MNAMDTAAPPDPGPWLALPFVAMLLLIALMPLLAPHWWERHYPRVAATLGLLTIGWYVLVLGHGERIVEVAGEYAGFMALIGSLYVVAGGVHIRVKGEATPVINVLFLGLGAVLANLLGTTGASMLLIRPWIRMNRYRVTSFHIVFFIFLVSNIGGSLTPVGDPPLFLGYLRGVPFWWTIQHLWPAWLLAVLAVLAVFFVLDQHNFRRAPRTVREQETEQEEWRFDGLTNLAFLAVILAAVFLPSPWREGLMVLAAAASRLTTPPEIYRHNEFDLGPVREVAWLFAGIFATMAPALDYLARNAGDFGISSPAQFFWFTGMLSSFLDNAPTYLTFLATAAGLAGLAPGDPAEMLEFSRSHSAHLAAISLGAVFFGAMSYIGNGPNFMVKALAVRAHIRMPGFFAYILFYAVPVLLPVFFVISRVFFP